MQVVLLLVLEGLRRKKKTGATVTEAETEAETALGLGVVGVREALTPTVIDGVTISKGEGGDARAGAGRSTRSVTRPTRWRRRRGWE